jgi:hypothetical protein
MLVENATLRGWGSTIGTQDIYVTHSTVDWSAEDLPDHRLVLGDLLSDQLHDRVAERE